MATAIKQRPPSLTGMTAEQWEDQIPVKLRRELGGAMLRGSGRQAACIGTGAMFLWGTRESRTRIIERRYNLAGNALRDAVMYLEYAVDNNIQRDGGFVNSWRE